MTRQRMTRRLLPVVFVVAGALLLVLGARLLVAGVSAYRAEAFMAHWTVAAEEPAPAAWQVAAAAARHAVSSYPVANGDYLDRLGRVHAWQAFRQPAGQAAASASRREALAAYRAAIAARPAWPDTHARLAYAKWWLAERDDEFEAALAAADRLGRHRGPVTAELAEIGLAAWPVLNETQRQRTGQQARRLLAQGPQGEQRLLALGLAHGLPAPVCVAAKDAVALRPLCAAAPRG